MSRAIAVVRPEPGNAATADRIIALGLEAIRVPLFAVRRIGWLAPDPADHDALLLTSANAVRHAGPQLERLRGLPVLAVGAATATAARLAGFDVVMSGTADAARLIRTAAHQGIERALHLAGRDRTLMVGGPVSAIVTVYASEEIAIAPDALARLTECVVLLHSARAARRLAAILPAAQRETLRLVGISPAVVAAAGDGWDSVLAAAQPDDDALIETARCLID